MLKLIIREIDPSDKNGRYLRENLRRIEQWANDALAGTIQIVPVPQPTPTIFTNTDQFDTAANGQTSFTLTAAPTNPSVSRMLINGVEMRYGSHFSITGATLTFDDVTAGFALETLNEFGDPDRITVHYMVE